MTGKIRSTLAERLLTARAVVEHPIASAALQLFRTCAILAIVYWGIRKYERVLSSKYPIADWLVWDLARLWGYAILLGIACLGCGLFIVRRLLPQNDRPLLETIATSAAVGLVVFTLGMYAGGFLHIYNSAFALALPAVMIAVSVPSLVALARTAYDAPPNPRSLLVWASSSWGLFCLIFVYLGLMTPDAINFDAAWCHLPIAQDYARAGGIIPFPADYARTVPHLASIVHTWAFIVPGLSEQLRWMLALHNEFLFFLFTLVGVGAATQWIVDDPRIRGGWTAFFLFPAIFIYDNNIGGAADHYLAFFAPPLLIATGRLLPRFALKDAILFGVFAAGALLTKYQAVYLLVAAAVVLIPGWLWLAGRKLVQRDADLPAWSQLVIGPLAAALVTLVLVMPHFGKNWAFYNNPFYPFLQDTFRSSTPTTHNAEFLFEYLFKDWNWRPHGTFRKNLKDALELSYTFSFEPHYSFTNKVPNFGSLFTLCLPMLPFLRRQGRLWIGALIGVAALMMWGMTFRVDRNLQGFAPILAAVTAGLLVRAWSTGGFVKLAIVPLVALQIAWGGDALVYNGHTRVKSAIDLIRGGFEGKRRKNRYDYRREFREISAALPKNARVLLHESRMNLGINREIWLDWPGQQAMISYEGLRGPRELYEYFHTRGITHILHVPGYRAAQTKQEDVLFWHFIKRYATDAKRYGGYELLKMPTNPPPADANYQVLSIGLWGYRDGLYAVEAMNTYESLPRHLVKFPAPTRPLPAATDSMLALLDQASAATISSKAAVPDAITAELKRSFSVAVSYRSSFSIYIRNGAISGNTESNQPSPRLPVTEPKANTNDPDGEPPMEDLY